MKSEKNWLLSSYSLDHVGDRWRIIHIWQVDTMNLMEDEVCWLPDQWELVPLDI